MKEAVIKMAIKVEELLKHDPKVLVLMQSSILVRDMLIVLHTESVITDEQFREGMDEVDNIYPAE